MFTHHHLQKEKNFVDTLMKNSRVQSTDSEEIDSVMDKYLSQPCLPQEQSQLEFWKTHVTANMDAFWYLSLNIYASQLLWPQALFILEQVYHYKLKFFGIPNKKSSIHLFFALII